MKVWDVRCEVHKNTGLSSFISVSKFKLFCMSSVNLSFVQNSSKAAALCINTGRLAIPYMGTIITDSYISRDGKLSWDLSY